MSRTTAIYLTLSLSVLGILVMIIFALSLADSMAYRMSDIYDMTQYLQQDSKAVFVVETPSSTCEVRRTGDPSGMYFASYNGRYAVVLVKLDPKIILEEVTLEINCGGKILTEKTKVIKPGQFHYIDYNSNARAWAPFPVDVYKNWKNFGPAIQYYKDFIKSK